MADITFEVQKRERAGKGAARAIRREGLLPGVIYGDKKPPILIQMDPRPLIAQLNKPGFFAHTYAVKVDGKSHRVMAQDLQFDVLTDLPTHVDFLRVSKNTIVTAEIPVEFINEEQSPGLKRGGVLNVVRHTIEVQAKPDDLVESLTCDLTGFDVNESVHISQMTLPEGLTPTITDRDFTVATIVAPSGMKAEAEEEGEGEEEAEAE